MATTNCRNSAVHQTFRGRGLCMVISGSVLLAAGIAGIITTAIVAPHLVGSTIFALAVGPTLIGIGSRYLYMAHQMEKNPNAHLGTGWNTTTVITNGTTQTNHIATNQAFSTAYSSYPAATQAYPVANRPHPVANQPYPVAAGQTAYGFQEGTFNDKAPSYPGYGFSSSESSAIPSVSPPAYDASSNGL